MLIPSKAPFYGIVPRNSAAPLGTVTLPVTFGMSDNYRTKYIKFEVANFKTSYRAILGRLALAKFMVVPHYVYLLLKLLGNSGMLAFLRDLKKSYDYNQEAIEYASTLHVLNPSTEVLVAAQQLSQSGLDILMKKANQTKIQATGEVALKAIQLQEGDLSKIALISTGLDDK
jgi:hypothetical protein